jgi:GAF domain-containing protein
VVLLRGDVAVLHTGSRAVLAAADGVEAADSARQLSDPLEAMALGYRSQLSVPLWREGRRVGALAVLDRAERRFDAADIALLQGLAGRMDVARPSIH